MATRDHWLLENQKALQELKENSVVTRLQEKNAEAVKEQEMVRDRIDSIKESRNKLLNSRQTMKDRIYTETLATALNAIYMTALTENTILTNNGLLLSENMVYKFIEESGGAIKLLSDMQGKTYLLDTLVKIVEDAVEDTVDSEEAKESPETTDVPKNVKDDMFDKLEQEEDIETAVEIISKRISNAEEEFIRKNAEDKEKIQNIVDDINTRIQAAKDSPEVDEDQAKEIEQECTIMSKRKIANIRDGRPQNVFEAFVRRLSSTIMEDETLHESYMKDNHIEMDAIVETARCMYGFLEFVNTIQLEKVDGEYITKVLKSL